MELEFNKRQKTNTLFVLQPYQPTLCYFELILDAVSVKADQNIKSVPEEHEAQIASVSLHWA